jgi:hypothetical protein
MVISLLSSEGGEAVLLKSTYGFPDHFLFLGQYHADLSEW